MVPEIELSEQQWMQQRAEDAQMEFNLRQAVEGIYQHYMRGHITSQEAIDLVRPIEFELKRLNRQRHDVPFCGESLDGGAPAMDAEVMSFKDWREHWRVDATTGDLITQ